MQNLFSKRGDIADLAARLNINRVSVHAWAKKGAVPPARCAEVERLTGIPAEELNRSVKWFRVVEPGWPNGKPVADMGSPKRDGGEQ
jgi:DNA-binding transcriptional regulator YdaS (Cro superfamily)